MKFIIMHSLNGTDFYQVTEAETMEQAQNEAYQSWLDSAQLEANYQAEELSEERENELVECGEL